MWSWAARREARCLPTMVMGEKFLLGVAGRFLGTGETNIQLSGPLCCYCVNPLQGLAN